MSNITRTNAELKWQLPSSDGGSPITNYVVEKRDVRRKAWQTVDTTVKDLKYTVSPLNEGSLYVFRVAAENSVGTSEFCELEDAVLAKDTFSKYALLITERGTKQVGLRRTVLLHLKWIFWPQQKAQRFGWVS